MPCPPPCGLGLCMHGPTEVRTSREWRSPSRRVSAADSLILPCIAGGGLTHRRILDTSGCDRRPVQECALSRTHDRPELVGLGQSAQPQSRGRTSTWSSPARARCRRPTGDFWLFPRPQQAGSLGMSGGDQRGVSTSRQEDGAQDSSCTTSMSRPCE